LAAKSGLRAQTAKTADIFDIKRKAFTSAGSLGALLHAKWIKHERLRSAVQQFSW
jgi:hypothetical protein